MTPEDIAAVAEGLSEAQRTFLLSLPASGEMKCWRQGMTERERYGLRGFGQSGLITSRYDHSGAYHGLTAEGRAIVQHLQERSK